MILAEQDSAFRNKRIGFISSYIHHKLTKFIKRHTLHNVNFMKSSIIMLTHSFLRKIIILN